MEVGLDLGLILGIFHPLLGHKYLLDGLHKNDRGIRYLVKERWPNMMPIRHAEKLTKARSLFRDRNKFGYLTFFTTDISLGNRRGYSRASVR